MAAEATPTSPMLDLIYGKLGERWRFKEEADDLPCLRTPGGQVANSVTDDPSSWPTVVHEVIWAMESGLTFKRAVPAVVDAGLAGPMSEAEVGRLIRRLPAVQREIHAVQEAHAEGWMDDTVDIADGLRPAGGGDEISSVARDKLRVDARLSVADRRAKERYKPSSVGGKTTVNVGVQMAGPQFTFVMTPAAGTVIEHGD